MSTEHLTRRLSAIFSADVEGYSRLMRDDEEATVRTITSYRTAMTHLIQQYRGRVVDSPGDNILAEFTSVVDGVNCAVEIQRELAERNAELPENRRMQFRVGINLGDVLEEGERIYGDGVNIAARMESLAEAGGICISGTVYDAVESKIGLEYESLGEHEVKNIDKPIRAYRVLSYPGAAAHRVVRAKKAVGKTWRNTLLTATGVLVVAAAVAVWNSYLRAPPIEPVSEEEMAFPLPDKPSVVVLPFANIGDPAQEYIADGISEQIITTLARVPSLFVIASNSAFTYKGKPVKVQQASRELGVRYVVEGSVQRSGDRIRITAQLIDATKGHHMWAKNYDRDLKDLFAMQDEIAIEILKAIGGKLLGQDDHLRSRGTENVEAELKHLKARTLAARNEPDNRLAQQMLEESIALDPEFADAYALLGMTHCAEVLNGWTKSPGADLQKAVELSQKAIGLDGALTYPYLTLGWVHLLRGNQDAAVAEGEKAVALAPGSAHAKFQLGTFLTNADRIDEALSISLNALRLNPFPNDFQLWFLGNTYWSAHRYRDALDCFKKAQELNPDHLWSHVSEASTYGILGREEEARAATKEVLRLNPKFSIKQVAKGRWSKNRELFNLYLDGLRKAGLPEDPPLPIPDKPSIAVLPFENLSDDPEQEYFADGMTDDLITDLSRVPGLLVVSRNSTFAYKGRAIETKQLAKNLGARYVLEGSVRKVEDQVRINAQLIDAPTQYHVWAERFDGPLKDVFSLQDRITQKIVASLALTLTDRDQENLLRRETESIRAYDVFLKGADLMKRYYPDRIAKAIAYFEEAIKFDPNYSRAYASLSEAYLFAGVYGGRLVRLSVQECFMRSEHYRQIAMENPTYIAYGVNAFLLLPFQRRWEEAIAEGERCVALAPKESSAWHCLGWALIWGGRPEESIDVAGASLRVDPGCVYCAYNARGVGQFSMGRLEEALKSFERAYEFQRENEIMSLRPLAVTNALLGRMTEAQHFIAPYVKMGLNVQCLMYPFKDPKAEALWAAGLAKAGVRGDPGKIYKSALFLKPNLTGREIKEQLFGRTVGGYDICGGREWSIERAADGKATIRRDNLVDGGKSWIESDRLCNKWENFVGGYTDCMRVYANPEGTMENKDHYIATTVYGLVPFSVVH